MDLNEAQDAFAHGASAREAPAHDARTVRVEIGELALNGFGRVDPEQVSSAFQTELARLVRERGVPLAADGADRVLEALSGLPPLPATTSPGRLGEALARAVHAGLSGRGEPRSAPGTAKRRSP